MSERFVWYSEQRVSASIFGCDGPTGDDITEGDMLLEEGTVLGPRHLGMLAAVIAVYRVTRIDPLVALGGN